MSVDLQAHVGMLMHVHVGLDVEIPPIAYRVTHLDGLTDLLSHPIGN